MKDPRHPVRLVTPSSEDVYSLRYAGPLIPADHRDRIIFGEYTGYVGNDEELLECVLQHRRKEEGKRREGAKASERGRGRSSSSCMSFFPEYCFQLKFHRDAFRYPQEVVHEEIEAHQKIEKKTLGSQREREESAREREREEEGRTASLNEEEEENEKEKTTTKKSKPTGIEKISVEEKREAEKKKKKKKTQRCQGGRGGTREKEEDEEENDEEEEEEDIEMEREKPGRKID